MELFFSRNRYPQKTFLFSEFLREENRHEKCSWEAARTGSAGALEQAQDGGGFERSQSITTCSTDTDEISGLVPCRTWRPENRVLMSSLTSSFRGMPKWAEATASFRAVATSRRRVTRTFSGVFFARAIIHLRVFGVSASRPESGIGNLASWKTENLGDLLAETAEASIRRNGSGVFL